MISFNILSPSGKRFIILASTIFEAVQKTVEKEGYKFSNIDYLKLNGKG